MEGAAIIIEARVMLLLCGCRFRLTPANRNHDAHSWLYVGKPGANL